MADPIRVPFPKPKLPPKQPTGDGGTKTAELDPYREVQDSSQPPIPLEDDESSEEPA